MYIILRKIILGHNFIRLFFIHKVIFKQYIYLVFNRIIQIQSSSLLPRFCTHFMEEVNKIQTTKSKRNLKDYSSGFELSKNAFVFLKKEEVKEYLWG